MSDLRDLYQAVILDHNKSPRNYGSLSAGTRAEGHNPLCGDKLTVYLDVDDGVIEALTFEGEGCAISTASASVMTEVLAGKTAPEARALFERFHALVTGQETSEDVGKLAVFAGVAEFPIRVKCATLCWHTFLSALDGGHSTATTE